MKDITLFKDIFELLGPKEDGSRLIGYLLPDEKLNNNLKEGEIYWMYDDIVNNIFIHKKYKGDVHETFIKLLKDIYKKYK